MDSSKMVSNSPEVSMNFNRLVISNSTSSTVTNCWFFPSSALEICLLSCHSDRQNGNVSSNWA